MCSPLRAKSLAKMSPGVATPCPAAPPIATTKVRSMAGLLVKEKKGGLVALEAAASGIPGRHWTRFIDCESPAFEVLAVHFGNSLITAVLHFYETKSFGAAGVAIGDNADRFNRAAWLNNSLRSLSVVSNDRFPTYNFFFMELPL